MLVMICIKCLACNGVMVYSQCTGMGPGIGQRRVLSVGSNILSILSRSLYLCRTMRETDLSTDSDYDPIPVVES